MTIRILQGDCLDVLRSLPDESIHCCVTSPPYWGLRNYDMPGQLGLEDSPEQFIAGMVAVFAEVRRVLRNDGTLWLNIGDSYAGAPGGGQGKNGERASRTFTAKTNFKKEGNGLKAKDAVGIPWMLAFALRADGWYLRQDIIWSKPNPMPESVTDRCTKAHEYVFLLSKSSRYYFDSEAIAEPVTDSTVARLSQPNLENQAGSDRVPGKTNGRMKAVGKGNAKTFREGGAYTGGRSFENSVTVERDSHGNTPNEKGTRNRRSVWTVATQPFSEAHFATYPPKLIEPCILAGCPEGGVVLDPFFGAGTTGLVADRLQRDCIGIELNPEYIQIATNRLAGDAGMFARIENPAA